jgi:hypothetical protein
LDYLHGEEVQHRDIKPDNILILKRHAKLADFRLARLQEGNRSMSVSGSGTPSYMPPEAWAGRLHRHSDQYSFAVTYAELRLERRIFPGVSLAEAMIRHLEGPGDLSPLGEAEQAVLHRAMARDPDQRYDSCLDFVAALEQALASGPGPLAETAPLGTGGREEVFRTMLSALPPQPAWRKDETPRRPTRRPTWWLGLLVCLACVVGAVALWLSWANPWAGETGPTALSSWETGAFLVGGGVLVGAAFVAVWLLRRQGRVLPPEPRPGRGDEPAPTAPLGSQLRELVPENRPPSGQGFEAPSQPEAALEGHADAVWGVAFAPDGRRALSGSMDQTLRLWDLATGAELRTFVGHEDGVTAVGFAPDRRRAVSASLDGTARVWDTDTGREVARFVGHRGLVLAAAFAPDGRHAFSAGEDRSVRLWEVDSGREVRRFLGHAGWVTAVAVSPDGRVLVTGSDDGTVRLWDVGTGREVACYRGHDGPVKAVALSPDGRRAVSGGTDHTARVWDLAAGTAAAVFRGHADWVRAVAFSPEGRSVLSGGDDEALRVWDADTGTETRCLTGPLASFLSVAWSADGRRLLAGGDDHLVYCWT